MASFKDKKGLFATILFHGVILFLLLFFSFTAPKPEDDLEGILVNFGMDDNGSGNEEPEYNIENFQESSQAASQSEALTEELLTQKDDSPVEEYVNENTETEKLVENTNTEKETDTEKEVIKRTENTNYMYSGQNTNSNSNNSEGITEGDGNQGKEDGSLNSNNYDGGGLGTGVSFNLSGRKGVSLPSPPPNFQVEGIVVVEVTVDRQGKVIKAIPGIKKSTTLNAKLLKLAKEAALKAKFNTKADAPVLQKGSITYIFRLK